MELILGKTAGFCFGVKNAVDKSIEQLETNKKMYCLGELVHNTQVTEDLVKNGMIFVDNIEDAKSNVIIRSHGVTKQVYERAQELQIETIDLTCPKVLKIHHIAEEYRDKDYYIFIIGQSEHPEIIGVMSFCGDYYSNIEKLEDVENALLEFKKSEKKHLLVIAQTTYNLEKFEIITEKIKNQVENAEIINTICSATQLRQEETAQIAAKVDLMIIIGGKHSSNSNKLFEISKKHCKNVIFVETKSDINIDYLKDFNKIGIMAGASTPQKSIEDIINMIKRGDV